MTSTYNITLDLHEMISPLRIKVKRGETGRILRISLTEGGVPVTLPEGAVFIISDNTAVDTSATNTSFVADGNVIVYPISSGYLATVGVKTMELRVISDGKKIYAETFELEVYDAQDSADSTAVEEIEDSGLDELVATIQDVLENDTKLITGVTYTDADGGTLTFACKNGYGTAIDSIVVTGVKGAKGDKGDKGDKGNTGVGIVSITKVGSEGLTDTYRISLSNGVSYSYYVNNGFSPAVTISTITGGHAVTITDKDHRNGQTFNVMDGQGGSGSSSTVYALTTFSGEHSGSAWDAHVTANLAIMGQILSATAGTYSVTVNGKPTLWSINNSVIYAITLNNENSFVLYRFTGSTSSNYSESGMQTPSQVWSESSEWFAPMNLTSEYISYRIGTEGSIAKHIFDYDAQLSSLLDAFEAFEDDVDNENTVLAFIKTPEGIILPAQFEVSAGSTLVHAVDANAIYVDTAHNAGSMHNLYYYQLLHQSNTVNKVARWCTAPSLSDAMSDNEYIHAIPSAKAVVDYVNSKALTAGNGISISNGVISVSYPDGDSAEYGGNSAT